MAAQGGLFYNAGEPSSFRPDKEKRGAPVPFKALLGELISSVEGAESAIIMDASGEAVQWISSGDGEQLRLRAAYVAVVFQNCKAAARNLELGRVTRLVIEYDGASFIIEEIEGDYLIALELNYSASISEALEKIKPVLAKIARTISSDGY
jgi:predicted regulator of Ras-like GTPase activity (Roadblock/LC7/MglB family)